MDQDGIYACVEYLTKYTAIGEPRSSVSKQPLNSIVRKADNSTELHRAIKVVMKTVGDYAAQETMHCITNREKLVLFLFKMVEQWNDPVWCISLMFKKYEWMILC